MSSAMTPCGGLGRWVVVLPSLFRVKSVIGSFPYHQTAICTSQKVSTLFTVEEFHIWLSQLKQPHNARIFYFIESPEPICVFNPL